MSSSLLHLRPARIAAPLLPRMLSTGRTSASAVLASSPHPVSQIRLIKFGNGVGGDSKERQLYQAERVALQKMHHSFWEHNNAHFAAAKAAFEDEIFARSGADATPAQLSLFYKSYLEDNAARHMQYNRRWWRASFGLVAIGARAQVSVVDRLGLDVLRGVRTVALVLVGMDPQARRGTAQGRRLAAPAAAPTDAAFAPPPDGAPLLDDSPTDAAISDSFVGASQEPFPKHAAEVLMAEINEEDIEIKPAKTLSREYALFCLGRFTAVARGEQDFFDAANGMATASEGVKSNAMLRCCKDLGVASELWDPSFIRDFKARKCSQVWATNANGNKKQLWRLNTRTLEYPWTESGSGGSGSSTSSYSSNSSWKKK
ncbi:hypothetical protein HDU98_010916 [Podochytrium sp. JEL0797]|nr:hypothetical protein HDU98_010916 [Podochytrium sp. JEL0797]